MGSLLFEELSGVIRDTAFETHRYFGNGFLEKVYQNALVNRLRKKGLKVAPRAALEVRDEDGTVVGVYFADLIVNDCIVVEVKATSRLAPEHVAQTLNYLKATGLTLGLLVNFGQPKMEFKRFVFESVRLACSGDSIGKSSPEETV